MQKMRALLVIGSLTLAGIACGETLSVIASTDMPRSAIIDGRTIAWRYVSVRAESTWIVVEARTPSCAEGARSPATPLEPDVDPCRENSAGTLSGLPGRQLSATLKLPIVVTDGPSVEITLRSFRWPTSGGEPRQGRTTSDLEIVQPYGPVDLIAGLSHPVGPDTVRSGWKVKYAGFAWRPATHGTVEFIAEQARAVDSGMRDDRYTARYFHLMNRNARAVLYVTRLAHDPIDHWRAGLNVDVAF